MSINLVDIKHAYQKVQNDVTEATNGVAIPESMFNRFYGPLLQDTIQKKESEGIPHFISAYQGVQGVGKTVKTTAFKILLEHLGYEVEQFGIDDFYKTHDQLQNMKEGGNPFYRVRGLPGTHFDEGEGGLLDVLRKAKKGENFDILRFDKSAYNGQGDRANYVTEVRRPLDFIFFEGWCVGVPHVEPEKFMEIMEENPYVEGIFNELDPNRIHFREVLGHIQRYQDMWREFDYMTIMVAEDLRQVEDWRTEQEHRLKSTGKSGMSDDEIKEFIKPYITISQLFYSQDSDTKKDIDCILEIGLDHDPTRIIIPKREILITRES